MIYNGNKRVSMAKAKLKDGGSSARIKKPKVKRKGIHSKKKSSTSKNATHYKKPYKSQGR